MHFEEIQFSMSYALSFAKFSIILTNCLFV